MERYCIVCEDRLDERNTNEREDRVHPDRCLACQDEPLPEPEEEE